MEKTVYDITEICAMFKTTSRTLRFYEQKGLISSIRDNDSSRRQYAKTQLEQIRNVLVLRKLGLSIKKIEELQKQDTDLKTALLEKRRMKTRMFSRRISILFRRTIAMK